jgi:hypothetical protein
LINSPQPRVDGPFEYGTWREGAQGKRTDLDSAYELIRSGKSARDLLDQQPSTYIRFNRGLRDALFIHNSTKSKKEKREIFVELYYGAPGTGKTKHAFDTYPGIYILTRGSGSNVWWDGYEDEETILLDDFYGWIPMHLLLQYLDVYPTRLEIKGGHTWANWRHIVITSNKQWDEWYQDSRGDPAALSRRLHRIVCFKSDGSTTVEKEESFTHKWGKFRRIEEEEEEAVLEKTVEYEDSSD